MKERWAGNAHQTTPTNIYGVAVFANGVLGIVKDTRGPARDQWGALVLVSREWTGETFPETRQGQKDATAFVAAKNRETAKRLQS